MPEYGMDILILFGGGLLYLFTVVIAYRVFMYLGWTNAAESPVIVGWPIVLMVWVFGVWPFMFFIWVTGAIPKRIKAVTRRRKQTVREVK